MYPKLKLVLTSLLALTLTGCAVMPKVELTQYRQAFEQVQQTSEEILIDFSEAKENAEKQLAENKIAKADASKQPEFFSVSLDDAGSKQLNAVEVRRTAFRTIDKFNNVLVTLAEGKSIETVQNTAGGFVDAAGKFIAVAVGNSVPGLGALTNIIKPLVALFEEARLRKEFEKALQSGAPIMGQMLDAIYDEREDHLTLRAIEANEKQLDIVNDITSATGSILELFKQYKAPAQNDSREVLEKALNDTLKPAEKVFTHFPVKLAYQPNRPAAFGREQEMIAEQAIAQIKDRVAAFQSNVEQYQRLKNALENYGVMLEKTRNALNDLVAALDNPQKFEVVSEEFFKIAFVVKKEIEAFKAARKAVQ